MRPPRQSRSIDTRPDRLAIELFERLRGQWQFASDLFAEMRGHLDPAAQAAVVAAVHGMTAQARRVAWTVTTALGAPADDPAALPAQRHFWAWRLLGGHAPGDTPDDTIAAAVQRADPTLPVAAVLAADAALAREPDPCLRLGRCRSLPDFLAARLVAAHGDDADALAAALLAPPPRTLRAHRPRMDRDALARALAAAGIATAPTPHAQDGLWLRTDCNPFTLDTFRQGAFELMDEGSQLVAEVVAPPPGGLVIDVCAGAGGKTLALGALLGGRGRVVASDLAVHKLDELRRRARRAGLSNVQAVAPADLATLQGRADRVLVDAPCTGTGVLRRNPEARWRLREDDIARLARTQAALLVDAAALVAPGGRLIHATCSLLREENEAIAEAFLAAHPAFEPMPVKAIWGRARALPLTDPTGTVLRLLPHRHGTDGFFAAVFRRRP